MSYDLSIAAASGQLDDVVRRAHADGEPVILTNHDNPVAAIITIDQLRQLQQTQDATDIAECIRSRDDTGPRRTHAEVLAWLAAQDAAEA
jgi:prevent-host-death family protein